MKLGIGQIAPHAENGTDAREGGTAVEKIVDQRAKSGGNGGLDVPHPHLRAPEAFICFIRRFLHPAVLPTLSYFAGLMLKFYHV